jgi:NTE family protein
MADPIACRHLTSGNFSLVLSGGGALGIAHLGILYDLELHELIPAEIVGTSMGGIIGACLAIGMREHEIRERINAFKGLHNWVKFSFSGNAVIKNDKIARIFDALFGHRTMKDVAIPLKLIATNLLNGDKRVFDASDNVLIRDAVLATMAIPGIFEEHVIDGAVYGDGFLCENLGISEASYNDILAVDVLGKNAFAEAMPENFFKTMNVLEMFERSIRLLTYNQSRSNMRKSTKSICLIEPDTKAYKTFHFHKAEAIRALGLGLLPEEIGS